MYGTLYPNALGALEYKHIIAEFIFIDTTITAVLQMPLIILSS